MEVYPETTSGSKEAKKGRGLGGCLPFPSLQSTTAVSLRLFPFTPHYRARSLASGGEFFSLILIIVHKFVSTHDELCCFCQLM